METNLEVLKANLLKIIQEAIREDESIIYSEN